VGFCVCSLPVPEDPPLEVTFKGLYKHRSTFCPQIGPVAYATSIQNSRRLTAVPGGGGRFSEIPADGFFCDRGYLSLPA